jgi:hypothetical protein
MMLHPNTMITTDYGDIKLKQALVNMRIQSIEGWVYIIRRQKMRLGKLKWKFVTDAGTVISDKNTMFLQDDHRIRCTKLKIGDKVQTIDGYATIEKKIYVRYRKDFYSVDTSSYNSSFALKNGILVIG